MTMQVQVLWAFDVQPVKGGEPAKGGVPARRRGVAVSRDGRYHVISFPAGMPDGAEIEVETEISFALSDGIALCEAILSGNQQAMTRPGALRIVAATTKILAGLLFEPGATEAMQAFAAKGAA